MADNIKWAGASTLHSLESNGGLLTNDTIVQANDNDYPGNTALNTYAWIEFVGTWATAPDDDKPTVDVYWAGQPNGTNFATDPVTSGTDCEDQFVVSVPIRKVTSQQRKVVGPISIPPHASRFFLDNQTGQSLSGAWVLNLWVNNLGVETA